MSLILVLPKPKDHLTNVELTPTATFGHPIRLINLTTGARTQLVVSSASSAAISIDGTKAINFVNPAMIGTETDTSGAEPVTTNKSVATAQGDHIRIFWEEVVTGAANEAETAIEVTISPDTFPGTYKIVGDTFMRSEKTGKDEPFQFIINKAKVLSEVTLTLEAEGDPSTFEMQLNVLRSTNDDGENEMMKLVRYSIGSGESTSSGNDYGSIGTGSGG